MAAVDVVLVLVEERREAIIIVQFNLLGWDHTMILLPFRNEISSNTKQAPFASITILGLNLPEVSVSAMLAWPYATNT